MRRYGLSIGILVIGWLLLAGCRKQESAQPAAPVPETTTQEIPPAVPAAEQEAPPSEPAPTTGTAPAGSQPQADLPRPRPVGSPQAAPKPASAELVSLEGLKISLEPREKRALLLLFWNTRDRGIDAQARAAVVLYRRFHEKGLDVLSICSDPYEERVTDFAERWQLPWPLVLNTSVDPRPMQRFRFEKTPACLLLAGGGQPVALKLDSRDEAHAAVGKALGASLADLPMPAEPRRTSVTEQSGRLLGIDALRFAASRRASVEDLADQVVTIFEEDDSRSMVDQVVDVLLEAMKTKYADVISAAADRLEVETQIRLVRAVMVKAPDRIDCVFPSIRQVHDNDAALEQVTRWDRSQMGRALVLAGEFDRGTKLLRKVAEEDAAAGAWWYMVGWSELCAGRAEPAREAFARCYRADGAYDGAAAKIAGEMSAFFLGRMGQKEYEAAQDAKIAQFFVGERCLLGGDSDRALQAYKACIKAGKKSADPWPCNWAQLRIRQMDGKAPGLPKPIPASARPWEQQAGTPQATPKPTT